MDKILIFAFLKPQVLRKKRDFVYIIFLNTMSNPKVEAVN